jgi:WhiB family transcriptional regulator, redox-sensing transcriptional regulator
VSGRRTQATELFEALDLEGLAWQDSASCTGADADLFFPERGASTRRAKQICAECTVRVECLEYAICTGEKFGIWGGLSERERRRIRKERSTAASIRRVS